MLYGTDRWLMTAGYSETQLPKKLGIKEGFTMAVVNAPSDYEQLVSPLPGGVYIVSTLATDVDLVHLFTNSRDELFLELGRLRKMIKQNGSIWVSWYRRAAKLPTEITEDTVRQAAFPLGLVDVKVCAVDEKWSGLKLVIRKENR